MSSDLTREQLTAIRDKALSMASDIDALPDPPLGFGFTMTSRYRRAADLRWTAKDCQAAIDGCPESMASVVEFIAGDHELELAAAARVARQAA